MLRLLILLFAFQTFVKSDAFPGINSNIMGAAVLNFLCSGVKDVLIGMGSVHLSEQSLHPIYKIIVNPDYVRNHCQPCLAEIKKDPVQLSETVQLIQFP
ncbi:hypothetical protein RUM43_009933 [Polyplax serrata]|uniref:Uncharacterized protein n=1 Tax=Polyplax serrata TaxID=468196 RepID=A0AAN8P3B5_POLSC